MLRLIIAGIIFYLVFKFIKALSYFTAHAKKHTKTSPQKTSKTYTNGNTKIDQKDIVEAEFVEINNKEEK